MGLNFPPPFILYSPLSSSLYPRQAKVRCPVTFVAEIRLVSYQMELIPH